MVFNPAGWQTTHTPPASGDKKHPVCYQSTYVTLEEYFSVLVITGIKVSIVS